MKYKLFGYLRPFMDSNCFTVPIYQGEDGLYIHETERKDIITGFIKIDSNTKHIVPFEDEMVGVDVDVETPYIFFVEHNSIIVGTKREIKGKLSSIYDSLKDRPFTRREIALFIEDDAKIEEAVLEINEKPNISKGHALVKRLPLPSELIINQAKEEGFIPYTYPGYTIKQLFELRKTIPRYVLDYMYAVRDIVKHLANLPKEHKVETREIKSRSFNRIVDEVLSGGLFIPELCYAGTDRKERASFIQLGSIKYFGVVVPLLEKNLAYEVCRQLDKEPVQLKGNSHFKLSQDNCIGKFSTICTRFAAQYILCFTQPSTIVSEELERILMESDKTLQSGQTSEIDHLRLTLANGYYNNNIAGLFDYNIAFQLVKEQNANRAFISKRSKKHVQFHLYLVEYDEPLSVGFFYPKGDETFKEIVLYAIQNSLMKNNEWHPEFLRDSEKSLVNLENPRDLFGQLSKPVVKIA